MEDLRGVRTTLPMTSISDPLSKEGLGGWEVRAGGRGDAYLYLGGTSDELGGEGEDGTGEGCRVTAGELNGEELSKCSGGSYLIRLPSRPFGEPRFSRRFRDKMEIIVGLGIASPAISRSDPLPEEGPAGKTFLDKGPATDVSTADEEVPALLFVVTSARNSFRTPVMSKW
jgi:hypothetical protein